MSVAVVPSWVEVTCAHCGVTFARRRSHYLRNERRGTPHYCARSCRTSAANIARGGNGRVELTCAKCAQPFTRYRAEVRKNLTGVLYCSTACYRADQGSKTYKRIGDRHEHRIVAEQMLGRPLAKGEVVHHIDGNRRNNAPENLQVLPSQAEHARLHNLVRWAKA